MDKDNKKMFKLGIFILIVLLFAMGLFIWGIFGKGTLKIVGSAPFSVQDSKNNNTTECLISPCEINLSKGKKSLIISKQGARDVFFQPEIKLWQTTDMKVEFQLVPVIIPAEKIPKRNKQNSYLIVGENGSQKLIRSDDSLQKAIAYFPRSLENPRIFGTGQYILITDKINYFINITNQTRSELANLDLQDISDGKWSLSGKYFIFARSNPEVLSILQVENKEITNLDFNATISQLDWILGDILIFVTNQNYSSQTGSDRFGNGITKFLKEQNLSGFSMGLYYPLEKLYSRIADFEYNLPSELFAMNNGESVYLKIGAKDFRIILRKF